MKSISFNVTVVVVTYNRLDLLKECIEHIESQEHKFSNIIIVNNASTDGTEQYLRQYSDRYLIINETVNGGGAKGFHDGVEYIKNNLNTDWVLLIDDDAMLSTNYVKDILVATSKHPNCKAFSGSVKTDGEIDETHRKRLKKGLEFKIDPVGIEEYNKESFEYDLCTFCGLFFKAELINKIGLPREDYFIWYDDTEYSLRIRKESSIININTAWINHKTKKAVVNNKQNWRAFYGIRNRGDVISNYGTKCQYLFYRARIKKSMYLNWIASFFIRSRNYRYNYELYRDSLKAMRDKVFGFDSRYHS